MSFEITCTTSISNTGHSECSVDVGFDVGHVFVPRGTEIDTEANAKLLATWTTGIKDVANTRWYPFLMSVKQEFAEDESVYEEMSQGKDEYLYTKTAKDRFFLPARLMTPKMVKNLRSFNDGTWAAYIITSNGYIKGKSIDGVKFLPIDVELQVEAQAKGTDSTGAHLPYTVRMETYTDWNDYGEVVKPTAFNPQVELQGLRDVDLAVSGVPNATTLVITVATDLNAKAVTGLILADFVFTDSGTPDSVAETPDGTYTFTDTDLATGSADLVAAASLSTGLFESTGSVNWTI